MEDIQSVATEDFQTTKATHDVALARDLRYVLTQQCNYHCSFCHKEGCDGSEKNLLDARDYAFIFSTTKDALGIDQVTLSGGEPMMRKDIGAITKDLHTSGAKITMVSNGALIPKTPEVMENIHILNLSLHTTQQKIYETITGSPTKVQDLIQQIATIHAKYPHLQIKLNSAIIHDQNTPESDDFAYKTQLANTYGWKLKYLELSDESIPGFVELSTFTDGLIEKGFVLDHQTPRQGIYTKDNVEVITGKVFCSEAKETKDPQGYCKQYNDIYLTPDGYLSTCPIDIKKIDAYAAIVSQNSQLLAQLLQETIDEKTNYTCPFTF